MSWGRQKLGTHKDEVNLGIYRVVQETEPKGPLCVDLAFIAGTDGQAAQVVLGKRRRQSVVGVGELFLCGSLYEWKLVE